MGRANFGGAQDSSQTLLFLYESYARRQEELANEAIRNAAEDQAAADSDAMNRWEAGEMSDEEWLAYAQQRLGESTDEEEKTYWRDIIRDSRQTIDTKRIDNAVDDFMQRIEDGTATWAQLRDFLIRERARQGDGSPLYEQLSDQIDSVNSTIRDNATNELVGRAQYLFQSGQISGAEAANMIRQAAERYRTSDPGRYYEMLSSAYDLQTYGAGSGGSGGGGSGGGSGESLSSTIDALEYTADAIDLLNDQFNNGKRVGTLPDGTEVVLGDEDGGPTATWREIDKLMVETLDAEYEAKVANGDRDAVEVLQRKEKYIETSVQPRNTIPQEQQFGSLTRDLQRALAIRDPEDRTRAVQQALGSMERWAGKLNTITTSTDRQKRASDAEIRENPELSAAVRQQTTRKADELRSGTDEFASGVMSFVSAARQAFGNPNMTPEQAEALLAGAGDLLPADMTRTLLGGLQQTSTEITGLAEGSWVRVMMSDGTMGSAPLVATAVPGPNGDPIRDLRPDVDFDGNSQDMVQVMAEVNGRPELVWAVGDYRDVNGERMLVMSDGRRQFARTEDGAFVDADGNQAVLPFFGASASNAQRWANTHPDAVAQVLAANGVDPATVDTANLFYRSDRLPVSREQESQRDYNYIAQRTAQPRANAREPRINGSIMARPPNAGPGAGMNIRPEGIGGGFPVWGRGSQAQGVQKLGQELGIKFQVQTRDELRGGATAARLRGNRPEMIDVRAPQSIRSTPVKGPNLSNLAALKSQLDAMKSRLDSRRINLPDFGGIEGARLRGRIPVIR